MIHQAYVYLPRGIGIVECYMQRIKSGGELVTPQHLMASQLAIRSHAVGASPPLVELAELVAELNCSLRLHCLHCFPV